VAGWFSLPTLATIPNLSTTLGFTQTGHMLLTGHTTASPKVFIAGPDQSYASLPLFSDWSGRSFTGVTIDANNRGELNMSQPNLSARALMRDFHFSSLPQTTTPAIPAFASPYTPNAPYFNQYLIYQAQEIFLCCADYDKIKNNNIITTFDGDQARTDSLKWNLFLGKAIIDYRVQKQYTKNLQTSYVVDGKQVMQSL